MFAREINYLNDHDRILENESEIKLIRKKIEEGDIFVFKKVIPSDIVNAIKKYLIQIGQNSLPNYRRIERGCPNFHRINVWDPRAYVQCCFHQFSFFPWNQDIFNIFNVFKKAYQLRNIINNNPKNKFLGIEPEDDCIARLSFQFYPCGVGGMNKHNDPLDHHQLAVPIMIMSKKGKDFKVGGGFVEKINGEKIIFDEIADYGDIVYFHTQIPHGVEKIDPQVKDDWLSFKGRWILIFAVNKLFDNAAISDAVDLEKEKITIT